jgi:hypothetical protein
MVVLVLVLMLVLVLVLVGGVVVLEGHRDLLRTTSLRRVARVRPQATQDAPGGDEKARRRIHDTGPEFERREVASGRRT